MSERYGFLDLCRVPQHGVASTRGRVRQRCAHGALVQEIQHQSTLRAPGRASKSLRAVAMA